MYQPKPKKTNNLELVREGKGIDFGEKPKKDTQEENILDKVKSLLGMTEK